MPAPGAGEGDAGQLGARLGQRRPAPAEGVKVRWATRRPPPGIGRKGGTDHLGGQRRGPEDPAAWCRLGPRRSGWRTPRRQVYLPPLRHRGHHCAAVWAPAAGFHPEPGRLPRARRGPAGTRPASAESSTALVDRRVQPGGQPGEHHLRAAQLLPAGAVREAGQAEVVRHVLGALWAARGVRAAPVPVEIRGVRHARAQGHGGEGLERVVHGPGVGQQVRGAEVRGQGQLRPPREGHRRPAPGLPEPQRAPLELHGGAEARRRRRPRCCPPPGRTEAGLAR